MSILVDALVISLVFYALGGCLAFVVLAVRGVVSATRSFACGYARGREMAKARKAARKVRRNIEKRALHIMNR